MKRLMGVLGIMISLFLVLICQVHAVEVAPRISDREIVERLTRLEEQFTRLEQGQKAILREMDVRFEAMDVRFEAMDMRFEAIDKRFDQLITVIVAIVMAFAGIVAVTIGFAIWDRRTMIRPFESKVREVQDELRLNRGRVDALVDALRKLAGTDPKVAEVLRSFSLL